MPILHLLYNPCPVVCYRLFNNHPVNYASFFSTFGLSFIYYLGKGAIGTAAEYKSEFGVFVIKSPIIKAKILENYEIAVRTARQTFSKEFKVYKILNTRDYATTCRPLYCATFGPICHLIVEYGGLNLASICLNYRAVLRQKFPLIVSQMMDRVEQCHAAGVVHNDIKIDNFVVNEYTWDVKIIDFSNSYEIGYVQKSYTDYENRSRLVSYYYAQPYMSPYLILKHPLTTPNFHLVHISADKTALITTLSYMISGELQVPDAVSCAGRVAQIIGTSVRIFGLKRLYPLAYKPLFTNIDKAQYQYYIQVIPSQTNTFEVDSLAQPKDTADATITRVLALLGGRKQNYAISSHQYTYKQQTLYYTIENELEWVPAGVLKDELKVSRAVTTFEDIVRWAGEPLRKRLEEFARFE